MSPSSKKTTSANASKPKRVKLSGAKYRKKKNEKDTANSKQREAMRKFLDKTGQKPDENHTQSTTNHDLDSETDTDSSNSTASSTDDEQIENEPMQNNELDTNYRENLDEPKEREPLPLELEISDDEILDGDKASISSSQITEDNQETLDIRNYDDPANWPKPIPDQLRIQLVRRGPMQGRKENYPVDLKTRRRFTNNHFARVMANEEEIQRKWLVYSGSSDAVFCFCCKLFPPAYQKGRAQVGEPAKLITGFRDWGHTTECLEKHERSSHHIASFEKWKELEKRILIGSTIDKTNQRILQKETQYWRNVLKRIFSVVLFLGIQNLAFQGSSEHVNTPHNGNFLKAIELLAEYDPIMQQHIERTTSKDHKLRPHYLGKRIQNEVIAIIAKLIKAYITSRVHLAKYYAIIADCTPDKSHKEQLSLIIRFIDIEEPSSTSPGSVKIREHFLGFVIAKRSTAACLLDDILKHLEMLGIPVQDMRGQGYDNGANMSGCNSGVQTRMQEINPRAFYVPCNNHTLNLVVNDAASCCVAAVSFFGIVQEFYNFFSASSKRWGMLAERVPNWTLKPLSDTRWESRINAIAPLRYQAGLVYDVLIDIAEDEKLTGATGTKTRADAFALAEKFIKNYPFLCSLVLWHDVLFEINVTSKVLQGEQLSVVEATHQLKKTEEFLEKMRTDEGFDDVISKAKELAEELEIEPSFPPPSQVRGRRRRRQFDYEAEDEPILDPEKKFRVEFFNYVLDTAKTAVQERFQLLSSHNKIFGFLYNIPSIKNMPRLELEGFCKELEKALSDTDERSDIRALELVDELQSLSRRFPTDPASRETSPMAALEFLVRSGLSSVFPNATIAFRILLTLPVSVAEGERSFSKLKIIKNYLRSTMGQERLDGLATISIEFEIAKKLISFNLDSAIDSFAAEKARKVPL